MQRSSPVLHGYKQMFFILKASDGTFALSDDLFASFPSVLCNKAAAINIFAEVFAFNKKRRNAQNAHCGVRIFKQIFKTNQRVDFPFTKKDLCVERKDAGSSSFPERRCSISCAPASANASQPTSIVVSKRGICIINCILSHPTMP